MEHKFEIECPRCKNDTIHRYHCDNCKGLGYMPTDEGESLLTFLRRHSFVQARDS
jgi:hypothetical protein